LQYLEQKHINHTPESHNQKIPKNLQEDILCLICNDGDYQENNLIVICSKCNISVHQKCYGIDMIPQGITFNFKMIGSVNFANNSNLLENKCNVHYVHVNLDH